jgi:hypothetical protein
MSADFIHCLLISPLQIHSLPRGKQIYIKTICHEISRHKALNEWIHPDMIGFYSPIDDWNDKLLEFNLSPIVELRPYGSSRPVGSALFHRQRQVHPVAQRSVSAARRGAPPATNLETGTLLALHARALRREAPSRLESDFRRNLL